MSQPPAFNLTPLDLQLLAMTDEEYIPHSWDDLRDIITRNDLGALKRKPSDLRRYLAWSAETKAKYGSMMNYICQKRLRWTPSDLADPAKVDGPNGSTHPPNGGPATGDSSSTCTSAAKATSSGPLSYKDPRPFADPADYTILRNDWPYGFEAGISHLVVWLRTRIPVESNEGHLTNESRALIDKFVQDKFVKRLAEDPQNRFPNPPSQVLWFKNWVGLQSVRALEHVHILVRDVPEEILVEWSGETAR
ncbi:Uncharacterized protein PECH_008147 [Penicillium ucsense]|uniref:N-acetylglucosamine-induced protein 1 n=1 Tax=Penicillium ucsense TaxID=2839758 RepID=A0A8J8W891_9EURO|nr:Uncharacterized protein PECM_003300 [Penicillium ucsense]KAF7738775.1 Uncharacterized protein PECH_008147 [Penicillium ucsense]